MTAKASDSAESLTGMLQAWAKGDLEARDRLLPIVYGEDHVSEHGVEPEEAEEVVRRARPPYPLTSADEKFLVWGPTAEGKFLQVVFVMNEEDSVFIIHARPLTDKEKKRYRRRVR